MVSKNYITSISVSNDTRNKLIALSKIRGTTQKMLLSKITDKEVEQLSSVDKNNFMSILEAVEIKDSFKNYKERGN
ncbi:hypothetical protein DB324_07145 [Limosilactobacillus reuteri]|uniref:DUF5388 domain-containing protein n=1 Tax=Limosilactobacillus TaxID=2742598 RepID=UPI000A1DF041|nr:DUF5388 domain-containing protein [Limosilactobacillus reuteri]MCC4487609.1 DUF5388 domain-containing protein [Limosilactobacillus reuteri]MDW5473673.1 DUF5388 domain-containing protein [Limosilactobacillus reuteri]PIN29966.1 hypothetical protein CUC10_07470 [Limosilactobacillus reuteri]PUH33602.1 hypothetical protein DB323_07465 [Limosilactobacillus reuteri]PUH34096.1 hypothetical protein DB324_07145 [Limosilactobacillus reuteri]